MSRFRCKNCNAEICSTGKNETTPWIHFLTGWDKCMTGLSKAEPNHQPNGPHPFHHDGVDVCAKFWCPNFGENEYLTSCSCGWYARTNSFKDDSDEGAKHFSSLDLEWIFGRE